MENNESKLVAMQKEQGPLLEVKDLAIDFPTDRASGSPSWANPAPASPPPP